MAIYIAKTFSPCEERGVAYVYCFVNNYKNVSDKNDISSYTRATNVYTIIIPCLMFVYTIYMVSNSIHTICRGGGCNSVWQTPVTFPLWLTYHTYGIGSKRKQSTEPTMLCPYFILQLTLLKKELVTHL